MCKLNFLLDFSAFLPKLVTFLSRTATGRGGIPVSCEEATKGHRHSENVCSDWSSLARPLKRLCQSPLKPRLATLWPQGVWEVTPQLIRNHSISSLESLYP